MKFSLDYQVDVGEKSFEPAVLLKVIAQHREALSDVAQLQGRLVLTLEGRRQALDYSEPIVRHLGHFLRKLPWVISGDTETLPLRNSEHCFGFTPAGDSVEVSYFTGTETEVEEYIVEPTHVRIDVFVPQVLKMGDSMAQLIRAVDATLLETDEDSRDLLFTLVEAQNAWRERQRQRR